MPLNWLTNCLKRAAQTLKQLAAALSIPQDSFVDGIRYAQDKIEGTMSLAIMTDKSMIVARDKDGRLPIIIGQRSDGYCFSFESFAYQKLGYSTCHELKAGEITEITKDGLITATLPLAMRA